MYAIVEIAGQQFKVEKDQQVFVHRLENKEGSKVSLDEVLLVDNDGNVEVGAPVIKGTAVSAKVLRHLQGDKVIVFKKKRRKGYQKSNGHRQQLTELLIEGIGKATAKKAAPAKPKKEEAPKDEAKAAAPAKAKAPAKKAPAKKTEAKKADTKAPAKKAPAKASGDTKKKAAPKAAAKKEEPKSEE